MISVSNPFRRFDSQVTRLRLAALLTLLVAALFAGVGSAKACAELNRPSASVAMPWLQHQDESEAPPTIVGLWHTTYTQSNGNPFTQSFKMWWANGIEFENAILPPTGGNICYGVWKETGQRSVKLHHIGIQWAPDGTIAGTFTNDEEDVVAANGKTYTGTFEFKLYDPTGNMMADIKGTIAATRVMFKTPSTVN